MRKIPGDIALQRTGEPAVATVERQGLSQHNGQITRPRVSSSLTKNPCIASIS